MTTSSRATQKPETRTQRRALRTRSKLLEAARGLFVERGCESTSIEQITERADLGKGTFYRHFSGKDEIMVALTREAMGHLTESLRARTSGVGSLPEAMVALLDGHRIFLEQRYDEYLLLFQGRLFLQLQREDPEGLEEPFVAYLDELEAQLEPFLGHEAEPARVKRLACAIAGFVTGFYSFGLIGLTERDLGNSFGPLRQVFVSSAAAFLQAAPAHEHATVGNAV